MLGSSPFCRPHARGSWGILIHHNLQQRGYRRRGGLLQACDRLSEGSPSRLPISGLEFRYLQPAEHRLRADASDPGSLFNISLREQGSESLLPACDRILRRGLPTAITCDHLQNPLACVPHRSDQCPDRGGRRDRSTKMKTFMIENETNNITLHATIQDAEAVPNAEHFRNEAGLAKLAANWPASRLVEIWNSLPGETPVKKFKDRATAVSRIWKAIQSLGQAAPAAEEAATVPEAAPAADLPETAPVPDQEPSQTAQPETVIP